MTLSNLNSSPPPQPHPFSLTFCLRVGVGLETALIEFIAAFPVTITEVQADTLSEMIVTSGACSHTGESEQARCSYGLHQGISRTKLSHFRVEGVLPGGF